MTTLREALYARHLNRAFRRLVVKGIRPTYQKAISTLRGILGRDKEGATLDPVKIEDQETFPIDGFNENLRDIEFDFEGLFESCTFLAQKHLETSIVIHESTQDITRQAAKIAERAERELLVFGSNFLDAVVIRFVDLEFIDQANTTAELNLDDGYATLSSIGGADRVVPDTIPDGPTQVESLNDDAAILAGSDFGAIFTDTLAAWQIKTAGDFLRFRFDLRKLLTFNRFRLESPDNGSQVDIRLSRDGLNFIRPTAVQEIRGGRVNMFFETQEARYIEIELRKPVPENAEGNVFTIQSVSMYTNGYKNSDTITTVELTPENQSLVKLLAVEIDAETPEGTSVDLEVAAISASGVQEPWRPVVAKILDFTKTSSARTSFRAEPLRLFSSSPALGSVTVRGFTAATTYESGLGMNDVYGVEATVVFPSGIPSNIDERSLRLFRVDNWKVDTQAVNESVSIVNKMPVAAGDKRKLYISIIDESHDIEADTTTLDLKREVITGSNITLVEDEDSKIVRAYGTLDPALNSAAEFTATITVVGDGSDKEVLASGTLPAFAPYFDRLFVPGIGDVDILEVDTVANTIKLDSRPDYTDVLGSTVEARFQSRSLTDLVSAVTGKTVTFSQNLLLGERVLISYNSPMLRTQEDVIKSSVVVRSSVDPARIGIIGIDYRIRDNEVELLPTTRLPNQGNSNIHPITVEFSYNRLQAGPTSYTTWCHVRDGANRLVNIAQPIRLFSDETVTWMDPRGRVMDLEGIEELNLSAGWHRFSIVGRRSITEHGDIDQASALWQLISLESAGGSFIFRTENGYFDAVSGFREPLIPAGRFFMERQALQVDKERFAYDSGAIMTNFRLDAPPDAVRLEPGNATVLTAADYRLEYTYHDAGGVRGVKARLVLSKDPGGPPSVTPIVKGLNLRFT